MSIDRYALPHCVNWPVSVVARWIEGIGFPQYRACFEANNVNGWRLVRVTACTLPQMGITQFDHIKVISSSIRELLGLNAERGDRSIALPPREMLALYLERQAAYVGDEDEFMSYEDFLEQTGSAKWRN